ncbi:hypothetical protein [Persicitalea sp.]|uniref:hypothetical protein n=1 Tax=Persicitalea sp. TaxID=3100273 RepID=UPI0035935CC2
MPSPWERFSEFVKNPKGDDRLGYHEESASRIPAEVEASQYRDSLAERLPSARARNETPQPAVEETDENSFAPGEYESNSETADLEAGIKLEERPQMTIPAVENSTIKTPGSTDLTIPYWLEDEDMLRDEGVLFGLSESDPTEKTDIIYNYFQHLVAYHGRAIEQQNERVQELNLFIGQKENRIQELQTKLRGLEATQAEGEHQLPRTLVGLALSIAMCVGNYYLIEETLRPSFASSSFVALGVFLAGMFNLFGRISLFHDTESNVSWRRLLEEVGMPFAAALFVFAQAWQTQSWWQATALFVFVFFLFLFAGKLFLSNTTVLRNDLRVWLTTKRGRRTAIDYRKDWEAEVIQLDKEIDELRIRKWQVLREQSASESDRDRLHARRDMLIKLFESEFMLARKMKGRLSERQLREIRGA